MYIYIHIYIYTYILYIYIHIVKIAYLPHYVEYNAVSISKIIITMTTIIIINALYELSITDFGFLP